MKDLIILVNLGGLTREADKLQRGHGIAKEIWGLSVRLTRPSQEEARETEPFGDMLPRSLQPAAQNYRCGPAQKAYLCKLTQT